MASQVEQQQHAGAANTTLVVGLGRTGLSCLRYLLARGRPVAVADSRNSPPNLQSLRAEAPDVPCRLGPFDPAWFAGFSELLVSPGVSVDEPAIRAARQAGARIRGDIDLFSEAAEAPIVAITGSNGKSTVTTLVGEMARAAGWPVAVGGNLGTPALDLLSPENRLYVLELSSFQLETTEQLNASAVTLLNISDDHLDRYADREAYVEAKRRIFRGCREAVVNADDPYSEPPAGYGCSTRRFGLSLDEPDAYTLADRDGATWIMRGVEPLLPVAELALRGRHNLSNLLAALCLGESVGLPRKAMLSVARSFPGLPHRCQTVAQVRGLVWINDSKATNVGASAAAIVSLRPPEGKIVLIAGGDGKGADFGPLVEPVAEHCRGLVLMGRDGPRIAEAVGGAVPCRFASSMEEAVHQAAAMARTGDCVLLSPACASLDQYRDYRERGERFAQAVEGLCA